MVVGPLADHSPACENTRMTNATSSKTMTEAQRAYETKRAAKAGMSLDRWMESKRKQLEAEAREAEKQAKAAVPKKPGFFSRLIDKAHKPI
jgi:hypothetical protein